MRDSHRLKEKYELSLDNRQIVTWLVAALVALGGTFVLGVVVGKKLAAEQGAHAPPDLLTAVDQKTTALEHAQRDASLTFQEELTRKSPSVAEAPRPAPEPRRPDEKKAEDKRAEEKKPEERKVEEKPALAETAEKPVPVEPEAVKPTPAVEKPEPQRHEPEKVAHAEPARPEPRKAEPVMPEKPREEPVTTRTRDGGSLKDAFARAQKVPEPAAAGTWALQLAAYQDKAEAERFAAGLRDKGYAPYLVHAEVAGKGTWYRIRMGHFASREAASAYLTDFKRETSMSAIVTSGK